jgi:hypothetical protein
MQDIIGKVGGSANTNGMCFPATKAETLEHARKNHLPGEIINQLEKIPDKKYLNLGELISSAAKGL